MGLPTSPLLRLVGVMDDYLIFWKERLGPSMSCACLWFGRCLDPAALCSILRYTFMLEFEKLSLSSLLNWVPPTDRS